MSEAGRQAGRPEGREEGKRKERRNERVKAYTSWRQVRKKALCEDLCWPGIKRRSDTLKSSKLKVL